MSSMTDQEDLRKWIGQETEHFDALVKGILFEKLRDSKIKIAATTEQISFEFHFNSKSNIPYVLKTTNVNEKSKPNKDPAVELSAMIFIRKEGQTYLWLSSAGFQPGCVRAPLAGLPGLLSNPSAAPTPWRLVAAHMNSYRCVKLPEFIRQLQLTFSPQLDTSSDYDFSAEGAKAMANAKTCCDQCNEKPTAAKLLLCGHCKVASYCSKDCQVVRFFLTL